MITVATPPAAIANGTPNRLAATPLSNAPADSTTGRRNPRTDSVTDMSFVSGKLIVAGLSNEEFASKLRAVKYPFATADNGTSVEIFHGAHGRFETRSPVRTFVPFEIDGIVAGDVTPGHRFMAPGPIRVRGLEDYAAKLEAAKVVLEMKKSTLAL